MKAITKALVDKADLFLRYGYKLRLKLDTPEKNEYLVQDLKFGKLVRIIEYNIQSKFTQNRLNWRWVCHPNIVNLHEYFVHENKLYFVFENCGFNEVGKYFFNNSIPLGHERETICKKWTYHCLSALKHCNDIGLYHTNFNFYKVLLDDEQNAKLANFDDLSYIEPTKTEGCLGKRMNSRQKESRNQMWCIGAGLLELLLEQSIYGRNFQLTNETLSKKELKRAVQQNIGKLHVNLKNTDLSNDCKDFLNRSLAYKPTSRLTLEEAMNHIWFFRDERLGNRPVSPLRYKVSPDVTIADAKAWHDSMSSNAGPSQFGSSRKETRKKVRWQTSGTQDSEKSNTSELQNEIPVTTAAESSSEVLSQLQSEDECDLRVESVAELTITGHSLLCAMTPSAPQLKRPQYVEEDSEDTNETPSTIRPTGRFISSNGRANNDPVTTPTQSSSSLSSGVRLHSSPKHENSKKPIGGIRHVAQADQLKVEKLENDNHSPKKCTERRTCTVSKSCKERPKSCGVSAAQVIAGTPKRNPVCSTHHQVENPTKCVKGDKVQEVSTLKSPSKPHESIQQRPKCKDAVIQVTLSTTGICRNTCVPAHKEKVIKKPNKVCQTKRPLTVAPPSQKVSTKAKTEDLKNVPKTGPSDQQQQPGSDPTTHWTTAEECEFSPPVADTEKKEKTTSLSDFICEKKARQDAIGGPQCMKLERALATRKKLNMRGVADTPATSDIFTEFAADEMCRDVCGVTSPLCTNKCTISQKKTPCPVGVKIKESRRADGIQPATTLDISTTEVLEEDIVLEQRDGRPPDESFREKADKPAPVKEYKKDKEGSPPVVDTPHYRSQKLDKVIEPSVEIEAAEIESPVERGVVEETQVSDPISETTSEGQITHEEEDESMDIQTCQIQVDISETVVCSPHMIRYRSETEICSSHFVQDLSETEVGSDDVTEHISDAEVVSSHITQDLSETEVYSSHVTPGLSEAEVSSPRITEDLLETEVGTSHTTQDLSTTEVWTPHVTQDPSETKADSHHMTQDLLETEVYRGPCGPGHKENVIKQPNKVCQMKCPLTVAPPSPKVCTKAKVEVHVNHKDSLKILHKAKPSDLHQQPVSEPITHWSTAEECEFSSSVATEKKEDSSVSEFICEKKAKQEPIGGPQCQKLERALATLKKLKMRGVPETPSTSEIFTEFAADETCRDVCHAQSPVCTNKCTIRQKEAPCPAGVKIKESRRADPIQPAITTDLIPEEVLEEEKVLEQGDSGPSVESFKENANKRAPEKEHKEDKAISPPAVDTQQYRSQKRDRMIEQPVESEAVKTRHPKTTTGIQSPVERVVVKETQVPDPISEAPSEVQITHEEEDQGTDIKTCQIQVEISERVVCCPRMTQDLSETEVGSSQITQDLSETVGDSHHSTQDLSKTEVYSSDVTPVLSETEMGSSDVSPGQSEAEMPSIHTILINSSTEICIDVPSDQEEESPDEEVESPDEEEKQYFKCVEQDLKCDREEEKQSWRGSKWCSMHKATELVAPADIATGRLDKILSPKVSEKIKAPSKICTPPLDKKLSPEVSDKVKKMEHKCDRAVVLQHCSVQASPWCRVDHVTELPPQPPVTLQPVESLDRSCVDKGERVPDVKEELLEEESVCEREKKHVDTVAPQSRPCRKLYRVIEKRVDLSDTRIPATPSYSDIFTDYGLDDCEFDDQDEVNSAVHFAAPQDVCCNAPPTSERIERVEYPRHDDLHARICTALEISSNARITAKTSSKLYIPSSSHFEGASSHQDEAVDKLRERTPCTSYLRARTPQSAICTSRVCSRATNSQKPNCNVDYCECKPRARPEKCQWCKEGVKSAPYQVNDRCIRVVDQKPSTTRPTMEEECALLLTDDEPEKEPEQVSEEIRCDSEEEEEEKEKVEKEVTFEDIQDRQCRKLPRVIEPRVDISDTRFPTTPSYSDIFTDYSPCDDDCRDECYNNCERIPSRTASRGIFVMTSQTTICPAPSMPSKDESCRTEIIDHKPSSSVAPLAVGPQEEPEYQLFGVPKQEEEDDDDFPCPPKAVKSQKKVDIRQCKKLNRVVKPRMGMSCTAFPCTPSSSDMFTDFCLSDCPEDDCVVDRCSLMYNVVDVCDMCKPISATREVVSTSPGCVRPSAAVSSTAHTPVVAQGKDSVGRSSYEERFRVRSHGGCSKTSGHGCGKNNNSHGCGKNNNCHGSGKLYCNEERTPGCHEERISYHQEEQSSQSGSSRRLAERMPSEHCPKDAFIRCNEERTTHRPKQRTTHCSEGCANRCPEKNTAHCSEGCANHCPQKNTAHCSEGCANHCPEKNTAHCSEGCANHGPEKNTTHCSEDAYGRCQERRMTVCSEDASIRRHEERLAHCPEDAVIRCHEADAHRKYDYCHRHEDRETDTSCDVNQASRPVIRAPEVWMNSRSHKQHVTGTRVAKSVSSSDHCVPYPVATSKTQTEYACDSEVEDVHSDRQQKWNDSRKSPAKKYLVWLTNQRASVRGYAALPLMSLVKTDMCPSDSGEEFHQSENKRNVRWNFLGMRTEPGYQEVPDAGYKAKHVSSVSSVSSLEYSAEQVVSHSSCSEPFEEIEGQESAIPDVSKELDVQDEWIIQWRHLTEDESYKQLSNTSLPPIPEEDEEEGTHTIGNGNKMFIIEDMKVLPFEDFHLLTKRKSDLDSMILTVMLSLVSLVLTLVILKNVYRSIFKEPLNDPPKLNEQ